MPGNDAVPARSLRASCQRVGPPRGACAFGAHWVHVAFVREAPAWLVLGRCSLLGSQPVTLYYCTYCSWVGQSTTNARSHLRKHNISVDTLSRTTSQSQSLQALYNKATVVNQTSELDSYVLKKVLNKDSINSALISLIIIHNLPFRLVESLEFHSFCQALNPEARSIISSHSTLKLRISNSWNLHKDIVRKSYNPLCRQSI